MREAILLLPTTVDHQPLQDDLIRAFGGFTVSHASGAWRAPDGTIHKDDHLAYTIAAEPSLLNLSRLVYIARQHGAAAHQQCVYVRDWMGEVQFVPTDYLDEGA